MPNRLRQINSEYGSFCGGASEIARNWYNNQGEVSLTALLAEGQAIGTFDDTPEPTIDLANRGPRYETHRLDDIVTVTIDMANRPPRPTIPMAAWDYSVPEGPCQIGYVEGSVITVRYPTELPAGIRYTNGEAIALTEDVVRRYREIHERRGFVEQLIQQAEYRVSDRGYLDSVRPTTNLVRMSLREYELPNNGMFQFPTLTILH